MIWRYPHFRKPPYDWIGLRENLQETPISSGKKSWFPETNPLNQSNDLKNIAARMMRIIAIGLLENHDSHLVILSRNTYASLTPKKEKTVSATIIYQVWPAITVFV